MRDLPKRFHPVREVEQDLITRQPPRPSKIALESLPERRTLLAPLARIDQELGSIEYALRPLPGKEPPAKQLGQIISDILADKGAATVQAYSKELGVSTSTLRNWKIGEGKQLPTSSDVGHLSTVHERLSGRLVSPEWQSKARRLASEAWAEPRTVAEKEAAARDELAQKYERDQGLAERVASLRRLVASLTQQLAAADPSGCPVSTEDPLYPNSVIRDQESEELLRRLTRARADLEDAIQEKEKSGEELRTAARRMVDVSVEAEQELRYLQRLLHATDTREEVNRDRDNGDVGAVQNSTDPSCLSVTCRCRRRLRLSRAELDEATIVCGRCGAPFEAASGPRAAPDDRNTAGCG